jgi:CHAT domain-containing protein/tetratricopeptide (TPR) repeat protein
VRKLLEHSSVVSSSQYRSRGGYALRLRNFIATCTILLFAFASGGQQADVGIRLLADKLAAALEAKDTEVALALWSAKSAQRDAFRKLMNSGSELREKIVGDPEIEGGVGWIWTERQVGDKTTPLVLECIKENGEWKLWKEMPAAEFLATRLVVAGGESDREALLTRHGNLPVADVAGALIELGREQRYGGNFREAIRREELALAIADRGGAGQAAAYAINNIALALYDQGDYAEALKTHRKSLSRSEGLHDNAGIARSLNNIGAVYADIGEFDAALDNYQKSLELAERVQAPHMISNALFNIGIVFARRGDYLKAFSYLEKGRSYERGATDPRSKVIDFLDTGDLFLWQGDAVQAQLNFQQALDLAQSNGLKPLVGTALIGLGRVAERDGDLKAAISLYQRSLTVLTEVGDKGTSADVLAFLGSAHSGMGDESKALEYYEKALDLHKAIGAFSETPLTMAEMARVYNRKGDPQSALKMAMEARAEAEDSGIREAVWRSYLQEAKALQGMRHSAQAELALTNSIVTIERLQSDVAGPVSEKETFFEDKLEPYLSMVGLLASSGRIPEAFRFAERAKARVLLEVLKNGQEELPATIAADERQHEKDLRLNAVTANAKLVNMRKSAPSAELAGLSAAVERARLAYDAYEAALYARYPQFKLERGDVEPVTLSEAVDLLPGTDSAFVEFDVGDETLYAFASSGGAGAKLEVKALPISRNELMKRVRRFRDQVAGRDMAFRAAAVGLYRDLLGPVDSIIGRKRQLVVVPDGVLWELPFQALIDSSGQYLLEKHSVTYAPSLTALKAMTQAKQQRKRLPESIELLAMGNPRWGAGTERIKAVYRDQDFGDLPNAANEVRKLERIYGEPKSHVYTGPEASESRFKAEAAFPTVLHLATHGILNNANPLYSFLLFAVEPKGSEEDGVLEARELLHMKLKAELVVLSACETARGRIGAGEGLIGLSWALLVSVVPTTVLSQWKVDSESTSRLMVAFHQNRRNGMSDTESLRAAALSIRKVAGFTHPFYWAPFIVIGAGLN